MKKFPPSISDKKIKLSTNRIWMYCAKSIWLH